MTIDEAVLAEVEEARQQLEALEDETFRARAAFNQAVQRLHRAGASLREIATALGMSHQRVHQIIGEEAIVEVEATSTTLPVLPTQLALTEVDDSCTACGAPRRELDKLLAAANGTFICATCVARATESTATATNPHAPCTYCGTVTEVTDVGDARICTNCLDSCRRILGRPAGTSEPKVTMRRRNALVRCSFCNASQKEVRKLIAGPGVYICELCMETSHRVAETSSPQRGPRSSTLSDASREKHKCSFCGKPPTKVRSIVKGGRARICDDCLRLCDEIIAAELND